MIVVSLSGMCESETEAARVAEVFGRVMTGLALEGIYVSLNMQKIEEPSPVGSDDE